MKNWYRILALVAFAVISSFATFSDADSNRLDFRSDNSISQDKYSTYLAIQGLDAIVFQGNRLNESTNGHSETISDVFFLVPSAYKTLFQLSFSQYNLYIRNCLINYRKSDLIFPFHYFW